MKSKIFPTILVASLLASCSIYDTIFNTWHPDHALVSLTPDWSRVSEELVPASSFYGQVGTVTEQLPTPTGTLTTLFDEGTYAVSAYTAAAHTSYDWTTTVVRVETLDSNQANVSGTNIYAGGWFAAGTVSGGVTLTKDKDFHITVPMIQYTRRLRLALTDELSTYAAVSIQGVLTGVAGSYDVNAGNCGDESNVVFDFSKSGDTWTAEIDLLGIISTTPELYLAVTFTNETTPQVFSDTSVATSLVDFNNNNNKTVTLSLSNTLANGAFGGTIDEWTEETGNDTIQ